MTKTTKRIATAVLLAFAAACIALSCQMLFAVPQAHAADVTLEFECENFDFDIPIAGATAPTSADITLVEKNGKSVSIYADAVHPVQWQSAAPGQTFNANWRPSGSSGALTFTAGNNYQCRIQLISKYLDFTAYTNDTLDVYVNDIKWTIAGASSAGSAGYVATIVSPSATAFNSSNKCSYSSDKVYWHYYDSSTSSQAYKNLLYIGGRGDMDSYSSGFGDRLTSAPWAKYKDELKTVVIGGGVTEIGQSAFAGASDAGNNFSKLTRVMLPEGLEEIDYNAFDYCVALKDIALPSTLKAIKDQAFRGCSALESLRVTNAVTEIGREAFADCTSLVDLDFQAGLDAIAEGMFKGCTSLTSINIPNSVASIEPNAFDDCVNLESATIPSSTNNIGGNGFGNLQQSVFENCGKLTIHGRENSEAHMYAVAYGIPFVGDLDTPVPAPHGEISDTVGGIMGNVSWKFDIPSSTLYITGNNRMQSFEYDMPNHAPWRNFAKAIKHVVFEDEITNVGAYALYECRELESVHLPADLIEIGDYAFGYCTNLLSIDIPSKTTKIGPSAFYCCWDLASVSLPNSLQVIDSKAFDSCSSLTSITIPDGVTTIGDEAFVYCDGLVSVVIPATVTSIGNEAFYGCENLETVQILAENATVGENAFSYYDSSEDSYVQLPKVKVSAPEGSATAANLEASGVKLAIPLAKANVAEVANVTWNGKAQEPTLAVTVAGQKLAAGIDYTIAYTANKNVGKATAMITGKGRYYGTKSVTFNIVPKPTTLVKPKAAKKALTVKWKKQTAKMPKNITGYQIMLAQNNKFTKGNKTVTVKGFKKTATKVKSLKSKKKYWVKIRTFTNVNGENYYSPWSKAKAAKVK